MKALKLSTLLFCLFSLFSCSDEMDQENILSDAETIETRSDGCNQCNILDVELIDTGETNADGCCIFRLHVSSEVEGCGQLIYIKNQLLGQQQFTYTGTEQSYEVISCDFYFTGIAVVGWDPATGTMTNICDQDYAFCL